MKQRTSATIWVFALYALVAVSALGLVKGDADAYSLTVARTRALGWVGLVGLCMALCMTPFARVCPTRFSTALTTLRRALGIGAAAAALLHTSLAWFSVAGVAQRFWADPQLRAGACSAWILSVLWLTSYPGVVRRIRLRSWKELHRLAYPALGFACVHVVLGPFAPLRPVLWLVGLTVAFGLLRGIPQPTAASDVDVRARGHGGES